jgi:hypothetical protein
MITGGGGNLVLERSAVTSLLHVRSFECVSDLRLASCIFALCWATCLFFGPESSPNSNVESRMGLVFSLLQRGSLRIDQFAPFTLDKAVVDGKYYSDKAPGQAMVALPFVGAAMMLVRAAGYPITPMAAGQFTQFYHLALWIAVAFTSALFTAAAAACVYLLARHLGASRRAAQFASLGFGFCTPALGWGTMFFGHAMAGGCLLLGFASVVFGTSKQAAEQSRWIYGVGTGVFLGLAILTEFTATIPGLIVATAGLTRLRYVPPARRLPLVAGAVLGALPFAVVLGLYNLEAFGSAIHLGYSSVVGYPGMKEGWFGVSAPSLWVLLLLLIGTDRGLLWLAPWLLYTPLAWFRALRAWPRGIALAVMGIPACYLLINAGYHYWDGGFSTGPRHLVPALPFVCLSFAPLWDVASRALRSELLIGASLGAALSLVCASVSMTSASSFPPVTLTVRFAQGEVHNVLASLGLPGLASLSALPVVWGAVILLFLWRPQRAPSPA